MPVTTTDLRIVGSQPLLTPASLARDLPLPDSSAEFIQRSRRTIEEILQGRDPRLLAIVGPCSIHDVAAALDYAAQIREKTASLHDALFPVMRVYFEKPRSVTGWKGLINDPDLDGSFRINKGLHMARELLLQTAAMGLPAASEFLDTTLGQFYAELVSFGAIGARTVESQIHRELVSGLSMPVGIKNRTDGNVKVAIDALRAARHSHWFPSLTHEGAPAILQSSGNDQSYLILRGGNVSGTNYDSDAVARSVALLHEAGLPESVIIDCSHGNSGGDPARQADVIHAVIGQLKEGNRSIRGVMLESHLQGGRQKPENKPLVYGRSITDACLSLDETIPLLQELAETVRITCDY
jgi:3-deoxy-7-phosphoheptulonate synthase